jgi:hypothetical protein
MLNPVRLEKTNLNVISGLEGRQRIVVDNATMSNGRVGSGSIKDSIRCRSVDHTVVGEDQQQQPSIVEEDAIIVHRHSDGATSRVVVVRIRQLTGSNDRRKDVVEEDRVKVAFPGLVKKENGFAGSLRGAGRSDRVSSPGPARASPESA